MTTRLEWQQLAEGRILDAQAHLAPGVGRWSAAYYLAGYAVECGLKACVLARVAAFPDLIYRDRNFSNSAWTHDLEALLIVADLKVSRDSDALANPTFYTHWQRVKQWNEKARYQQKTQAEAQYLFDAITDAKDGVMQWIRARW